MTDRATEIALSKEHMESYANFFMEHVPDVADNYELASKALELLAVARRPLSIQELAWAVALNDAPSALHTVSALGDNFVDTAEVMQLIQPFILPVDLEKLQKHQIMVHQSVKELILIKSPLRWNDANGLVRLLVDEATLSQRLETLEANLLNLCVRYLLLDEIGENSLFSPEQLGAELPQSHDLFDDNLDSSRYDATCTWDEWEEDMLCYDPSECGLGGLFAYASVYWVDHFSVATARSMPDIRIIEKLCQRGSKRLDNWLKQNCRPNCTFKPRWDADSELFDPLGVTALYGSRAMLDNMLITSQFEKEAYLDNSGLQAAHHIVVNHHSADLFRVRMLFYADKLGSQLRTSEFCRTVMRHWRTGNRNRPGWHDVMELFIKWSLS
ncbi:hypothetical protein BKA67DRAFT_695935 [Truncatella angustata]|uniref:Uncharacterized protein n=1 Tax=Truncatella angustata TaxID=152316 RepID=A0A9P8UBY1_9PEZI|nr:uncharacterized protein BKA67DRAFT_695935 [Truncatella angustata]KAH6646011.1 hypothetical protein BKA67DRAFT_695935 [Truncatella angustata]